MRFSEMDTIQTSECLVKIAPAVERIGNNPRVYELLRNYREKVKKDDSKLSRLTKSINLVVPVLLGECIEETVEIVSAMTGKSVEEVKAQKGMQTIKDVMEFADADFRNVMFSFAEN